MADVHSNTAKNNFFIVIGTNTVNEYRCYLLAVTIHYSIFDNSLTAPQNHPAIFFIENCVEVSVFAQK